MSAISADLYGGNHSCPASTSTGSPTFRSTISKSSNNLGKTTTTSTTMHPQQATVDFQTGAMTAPVPMSFQVNKKQLSLKHGIFACNVCDVIFARHSILQRCLDVWYHIQWRPLNVITDNVIIRLMLSNCQVPGHLGKSTV